MEVASKEKEIKAELYETLVLKTDQGFGIYFVPNESGSVYVDGFVCSEDGNYVAAKAMQVIQRYDLLCEINSKEVIDLPYIDVIQLLRSAPDGENTLRFLRKSSDLSEDKEETNHTVNYSSSRDQKEWPQAQFCPSGIELTVKSYRTKQSDFLKSIQPASCLIEILAQAAKEFQWTATNVNAAAQQLEAYNVYSIEELLLHIQEASFSKRIQTTEFPRWNEEFNRYLYDICTAQLELQLN